MEKTRRYLRSDDAANYIGFGKSTVEKLRLIGGGPPYIKAGKIVLYDVDDLDAWLAARRRTSTSDQGEAA